MECCPVDGIDIEALPDPLIDPETLRIPRVTHREESLGPSHVDLDFTLSTALRN